MQLVFPPTVVIEDFDWQNKHLIAPLKHSVLYFEVNLGTRPAFLVQCICCFLLVNQQMYGHTQSVTFLPFRHSVLISVNCHCRWKCGAVNTLLLSCLMQAITQTDSLHSPCVLIAHKAIPTCILIHDSWVWRVIFS